MKKIITTCFYLILTTAVITAIFFLPAALFRYEDQQLFAKVEHTEIEPVAFAYSYSLFDTLTLLSNKFYTVEYPSNGGTHTSDEICKITSDAFTRLNQYGQKQDIVFLDAKDSIMNCSALLNLAISNTYDNSLAQNGGDIFDGQAASGQIPAPPSPEESDAADTSSSTDIISAAIWRCHLYSEYGYLSEFRIDDKSGKIVGIFLWNNPQNITTSYWPTETLLKVLRDFLKNHYGMQVKINPQEESDVQITDSAAKTYASDPAGATEEAVESEQVYDVSLTGEFEGPVHMTLKITPEFISLN